MAKLDLTFKLEISAGDVHEQVKKAQEKFNEMQETMEIAKEIMKQLVSDMVAFDTAVHEIEKFNGNLLKIKEV